jgi:hypothetical protein
MAADMFRQITKIKSFAAALSVSALLAGAGCAMDKEELPKGEVDRSSPPGSPTPGPREGKADGSAIYALSVESAHPYANNLEKTFRVDLAGLAPTCVSGAVRVHFAQIRTEAGYDYVHLDSPTEGRVESYDGNRDDIWSQWVATNDEMYINVVLESDYSITRHGFVIDAVEFQGFPVCPRWAIRVCEAGTVDVNPARGVCECEPQPTCVALGDIEIEHAIGGGFTGAVSGKRVVGTAGFSTHYMPGDPAVVTALGTVNQDALTALIRDLARGGWLQRDDVLESSNWNETFRIKADGHEHTFSRPQGSFSAEDAALIARFEELFSCEGTSAPLACAAGYACQENACVEEAGCICPALFDPVCGANGQTYSNACAIACAGVQTAHDGACGITGDVCGTIFGHACQDEYKCRFEAGVFEYPFPDAGGTCVDDTYCDTVADCAGLPHIAVPGYWTCQVNACGWEAGVAWNTVTGWSFSTAHPYTNNQSVWKELYLPAGGAKMRLRTAGTFELESGYDKLEVFTWVNGAWKLMKTYTGTTAPALTEEFAGQYHYLHFVSDSSVVKTGFSVSADYSN